MMRQKKNWEKIGDYLLKITDDSQQTGADKDYFSTVPFFLTVPFFYPMNIIKGRLLQWKIALIVPGCPGGYRI
jgi:hypothetical protein